MLTKSLHTVTAVKRVALHLHGTTPPINTPAKSLDCALLVLGYKRKDFPADDPTIKACLAAIKKEWPNG